MDKKIPNESETLPEQKLFADDDVAPSDKISGKNTEILENVAKESESIASEIKTPSSDDHPHDDINPAAAEANENNEKIAVVDSTDKPLAAGSELPEKAADDLETDKAPDEEREDTEQKSVSSRTDESEKIQGSSQEQTPNEKMGKKQQNKDDDAAVDPAAQDQSDPEITDTDDKTGDFAQGTNFETPAGKISTFKVTISAIIITAVFSGFYFCDDNSKIRATSKSVSKTSEKREFSKNRIDRKNMIKPPTPKISSIYDAKIEEVTALRDSLLFKQEEVIRLKNQYQRGIEELEKEISDELQKGKSNTFLQAMENNSIAFTLRTIQRRQAYIQQLESPARWIHQACEELLYIKRRTLVDLQVAEIADGIDMDKHVRDINTAVRKYKPAADKLAPDMTNAPLEPLEAIWERIQEKTQQYASVQAHSKNQIISEQICTGNFDRLTELSELSDETARCIRKMQAQDLFLNGLSEILPGAAKQLSHWKGSWICLNGVRALSPRTARYLFQWDGNWISLNGLTDFPAEIGEILLQWDGSQLELMGLQYREDFPARIALEYLARWERAGGKLFVAQSVRKKIDEMHRNST
jgi:hypothetical protein